MIMFVFTADVAEALGGSRLGAIASKVSVRMKIRYECGVKNENEADGSKGRGML